MGAISSGCIRVRLFSLLMDQAATTALDHPKRQTKASPEARHSWSKRGRGVQKSNTDASNPPLPPHPSQPPSKISNDLP